MVFGQKFISIEPFLPRLEPILGKKLHFTLFHLEYVENVRFRDIPYQTKIALKSLKIDISYGHRRGSRPILDSNLVPLVCFRTPLLLSNKLSYLVLLLAVQKLWSETSCVVSAFQQNPLYFVWVNFK